MVNSRYVSIDDLQHYPYPIAFVPMLDTGPQEATPLSYDDERQILIGSTKELRIPNGSLEQCFCRVLFRYEPSTAVSWDLIAKEMDLRQEGKENIRIAKQRIKDVKRRLNAKIALAFRVSEYFRSENSEYYRK